MLARLQNQPKNNVDIGAACRMMAALDEIFRSKIQTAIMFCNRLANPKSKAVKTEI
jgi:hypothetical protein